MNPRLLFPSALLAGGIIFACSDPSLCVGDQCGGGADASLGDGGATGDATIPTDGSSIDAGMQGDAIAPPHCDTSMDISTQPDCVVPYFGLFVDSNADATKSDGTMGHPYATIMAAVGNADVQHARIFVCAGTYGEHVVVSTNVSLYGGFECTGWTHPTPAVATIVKPKDTGYALQLTGVANVVIEDVEVDARDGVNAGESSIAVFASMSNPVTFNGATINAGDAGAAPSLAETTPNYDGGMAASGFTPDGSAGVPQQTCACLVKGSSTGGSSGEAGNNGGGPGGNGLPTLTPSPPGTNPPHDGNFGSGAQGANGCGNGDPGAYSADADAGVGASTFGQLSGVGWLASNGSSGFSAGPAQGGGGGGGAAASGGLGAGGGGGCGGCGGGPGAGGIAGGSSFGVLSFDSRMTFNGCTITAREPSGGGAGGTGQPGQTGGSRGAANGNGCPGGAGGNGGNGGGGGGGAAGISVGIGWTGTQPTVIGPMPAVSTTSATGGQPGTYGGATGGVDGINASMKQLPSP